MFTREKQEMKRVPMMPVRDMVIFPQQMTPFIVGREASVRALEEALAGDKKIFLSTQHDASVDDPKPEEIYAVGTLANIVQSVKLPDGNIKVLVEGVNRVKKHERIRTTQRGSKTGGIVTQEAAIHVSNVMVIDSDNKPTRVGARIDEDGVKTRTSRRSGKDL